MKHQDDKRRLELLENNFDILQKNIGHLLFKKCAYIDAKNKSLFSASQKYLYCIYIRVCVYSLCSCFLDKDCINQRDKTVIL